MQITTFLMFAGQAEEAMNFYVSVIPDSRIVEIDRYDSAGPGKAGSVRLALFELQGVRLKCIDSPTPHAFTFTPAISLFVECDSAEDVDRIAGRMLEAGQALMPPGNYGFSQRFAWVQDRFGVSWQLNFV